MAGLQRSATTFRRSGSSGLVWDERFLTEADAEAKAADGATEEPQPELRHSRSVGSIGMLRRSGAGDGDDKKAKEKKKQQKQKYNRIYKKELALSLLLLTAAARSLLSKQGMHFYFLLFQGVSFLMVGLDLIGEDVK